MVTHTIRVFPLRSRASYSCPLPLLERIVVKGGKWEGGREENSRDSLSVMYHKEAMYVMNEKIYY